MEKERKSSAAYLMQLAGKYKLHLLVSALFGIASALCSFILHEDSFPMRQNPISLCSENGPKMYGVGRYTGQNPPFFPGIHRKKQDSIIRRMLLRTHAV